MNEFTNNIKNLLDIYYNGGMESVVEYIKNLPLSDETRHEIKQSFAIIDKMKEKRASLEKTKDDGYTTNDWSTEELDRISKK